MFAVRLRPDSYGKVGTFFSVQRRSFMRQTDKQLFDADDATSLWPRSLRASPSPVINLAGTAITALTFWHLFYRPASPMTV